MSDTKVLRAAAMEADARCNAARRDAELAQEAGHPGAQVALERFLVAVGERDRLRRALAEAEGRVGA